MNTEKMPKHIAIIMDGNRRWATRKRARPKARAHREGAKTLEKIVRYANEIGLRIYYSICIFYRKLETIRR